MKQLSFRQHLNLGITLLMCAVGIFLPATVKAIEAADFNSLIYDSVYYNDQDKCQPTTFASSGIERFLQVLAFQESSGNPTAQASGSSASGKYQYIDSTWRARASIYAPAGDYDRAFQAPEAIQDAVAYIEYRQKFEQYDGDLFKLALSHFYPAAITDESKLDTRIGSNTITPRQYAEKFIENMEAGVGGDIALLHPQAPEFERWLTEAGGPYQGSAPQASTGCTGLTAGSNVVEIAQRELAAGANEANGEYLKYTMGRAEQWCADFVSWVFREAGLPFRSGIDGWNIASVAALQDYAEENGYYHPKGEAGFTPRPGDLAIYREGINPLPSHTNIVVSYDEASGTFQTIGGNESDGIRQGSHRVDAAYLTGFMRVE